MSDKDFIYRIGPVTGSDGVIEFLHVYPGFDDAAVFSGATLEEALNELLRDYDAEELSCEPELAELCRSRAIGAEPFTPQRAHDLGLAVFELLGTGIMDDIERRGLIFRFLQAAAEFHGAAPWTRCVVRVRLEVSGEDSYTGSALVLGGSGAAPGMTIFENAAARETAEESFRTGDLKSGLEIDCQGVVFQNNPDFAIDALRRAHGLTALPSPFVLINGEQESPLDEDLAVLTAAMFAASQLDGKATSSHGSVQIGDFETLVNMFIE